MAGAAAADGRIAFKITLDPGPVTILTHGWIRKAEPNGAKVIENVSVRQTLPFEDSLPVGDYVYEFSFEGGKPTDTFTLTTTRTSDGSVLGGPKVYTATVQIGRTHLFSVIA